METADIWIKKLRLTPHPEGGYYREIYSSGLVINKHDLPQIYEGDRTLATSIYFLLRSGEISGFHQLKSDEIWYYNCGSPLKITLITTKGELITEKFGANIEKGEKPQVIIPAGTIFGAEVIKNNSFTLLSCMVSPGFDFNDFKLFSRKELKEQYPEYIDIIKKLTKP